MCRLLLSITFLLFLSGCSTPSPSFIGTWHTSVPFPAGSNTTELTFAFNKDGTGNFTNAIKSATINVSDPPKTFHWTQDGKSVNVAYLTQTDRYMWSLSDNGENLTLTNSEGAVRVYQKSP